MPRTSFKGFWEIAPSEELIPNLQTYLDDLLDAIYRLAVVFAAKMEGYARLNAPWRNRTGDARRGLIGWAVREATRVVLYLAHTVFYGPFLEKGTSKMRPYPIILPTMEMHYAELMAELRRITNP